jgi:tetratricopeptide (TPR) repeat protein
MRRFGLFVAALLLALSLSGPAVADFASDRENCTSSTDIDSDVVIGACTRQIKSGRWKGRDLAICYSNRGRAYFRKDQRDEAIANLSEAIRIDPKYATAYFHRARVYTAKDDHRRAIADYDQAIKLNPKDAPSYNNRGNAYRSVGAFDRAIADLTAALQIDPKDALYYRNRGLSHWDKGDLDRAIADFSEAIRIDPKYSAVYFDRAGAHAAKGDHRLAIADYTEAIRYDPKDAASYNNRGNRFRDIGEYDRAIADYTMASRITPDDPMLYVNRGLVHRDKGDLDRAIADFSEAIRHDLGYVKAYLNRGLIYEEMGDLERARADFNMALAVPQHDDDADEVQASARKALAALDAGRRSERKDTPPDEQSSAPQKDQSAVPAKLSGPDRRVALVIGNSAYSAVSALPNPRRDADALAAALRRAGFASVTVSHDLGRDQLVQALRAFEEEAETADWAMIYFAGHGIEINGVNYLVPVDAKLKADRDVVDEAVPLDRVLSSIENAKKLRLVVLDACRDNPFVAQMRRSTASRSIGRGLARIEPEGGTLVAYAAKHGQIALDGTGQNSPFVSALVKRLATPNLEINKLFRLVRDDVLAATNRRQEPFIYGSLPGEDFFFVRR